MGDRVISQSQAKKYTPDAGSKEEGATKNCSRVEHCQGGHPKSLLNPLQSLPPASPARSLRLFPPGWMNAMAAPNAFFIVSMVAIGFDGTAVVGGKGDGALGLVWSAIILWLSVLLWSHALCVVE